MDTKEPKEYTGGGVILLLNQGNDDFIVLTKRSEDTLVNPNSHSGFFGGAEKKDKNEPKSIAYRELNEELLITTSDKNKSKKKVFYLRPGDQPKKPTITKITKIVKKSIELWNKKLTGEYQIPKDRRKYHPLNSSREKIVEYVEHDGWKRIYIPTFNHKDSLDKLIFLDCETKDEYPRKYLLDRQIDIFRLKDFKDWWLSNNSLCLKARLSFKSGRMIASGWIVRENKRISPSLVLALNQWRFNNNTKYS
jgi:hypothetical protein